MKKFYIILSIIALAITLSYLLIPNEIKLENSTIVQANFNNINRQLLIKNNWINWFPENNNKFIIDEFEFSFSKTPNENVLVVNVNQDKNNFKAYYQLSQIAFDSILIQTTSTTKSKSGWINDKIKNYFFSKKLNKALNSFIGIFKKFAEDKKSFYGLTAKLTKLPDSCMIAKKAICVNYPTTHQIYKEIEALEQYAKANNASAIKPPMLHVKQLQPLGYEFMVSLPVNKRLASKGDIVFKQMLPYGNYLESDSIIGFTKKVDSLFLSFENYKNDYNFTSPAIPFQSLITNRKLIKDSTKWVTKFYYPVF
ncbi:MAG: hypothetical protein ACOVMM_00840 [Chitinophagaceae bacterium]